MVIDKDLILLDLTGDKKQLFIIAMNMKEPQVTKNTLKDPMQLWIIKKPCKFY